MTALDYIQGKGLEYRIQSGQAVLKICPFCGDQKNHFYIDQTEGAFFCHKCQEGGNLITLKKHFGDFNPDWQGMTRPTAKPQGSVKQAFGDKGKPYPYPDEKEAIEAHE